MRRYAAPPANIAAGALLSCRVAAARKMCNEACQPSPRQRKRCDAERQVRFFSIHTFQGSRRIANVAVLTDRTNFYHRELVRTRAGSTSNKLCVTLNKEEQAT
ncbi:MAG: hypothetical protein EOO38_21120 [Cytophagaceae bacterium]|nr:MAG: hypothetical protein EOO38_21120 [Cytophagaceae bacterium]